jgi:hypothetical protein
VIVLFPGVDLAKAFISTGDRLLLDSTGEFLYLSAGVRNWFGPVNGSAPEYALP